MRIALGLSYNGQAYNGWQVNRTAIPFKTNSKRPWAALLLKRSPLCVLGVPTPVYMA